jgi:hypothetical protein
VNSISAGRRHGAIRLWICPRNTRARHSSRIRPEPLTATAARGLRVWPEGLLLDFPTRALIVRWAERGPVPQIGKAKAFEFVVPPTRTQKFLGLPNAPSGADLG